MYFKFALDFSCFKHKCDTSPVPFQYLMNHLSMFENVCRLSNRIEAGARVTFEVNLKDKIMLIVMWYHTLQVKFDLLV
jgi:hypothetical protein